MSQSLIPGVQTDAEHTIAEAQAQPITAQMCLALAVSGLYTAMFGTGLIFFSIYTNKGSLIATLNLKCRQILFERNIR